MRSLEEVLAELKAAEKEYADKCAKYGIEEKHKKKKNADMQLDENGNPIEQIEGQENQTEETVIETPASNEVIQENNVEEAK